MSDQSNEGVVPEADRSQQVDEEAQKIAESDRQEGFGEQPAADIPELPDDDDDDDD